MNESFISNCPLMKKGLGLTNHILLSFITWIGPARALIGQKPMFYQGIKHRKSVFYRFTCVKSISSFFMFYQGIKHRKSVFYRFTCVKSISSFENTREM